MAQTPTERLTANIRAAAETRKVSMSGLAGALGVARSTLYRRLEGAERWTWTYVDLVNAAQYIGVPVSDLTAGVEELYATDAARTAERSA